MRNRCSRSRRWRTAVWHAPLRALARSAHRAARTRGVIPGLLAGLSLCIVTFAAPPAAHDGVSVLLEKADADRNVNYEEFASILESVEKQRDSMAPAQREYLQYLQAWKSAYDGDQQTALARLTTLMDNSQDRTLRLRAGATAVTMLIFGKRYEEAFSRLSGVLELLPEVSDTRAREQALLNAAALYNEVGQYDLSLSYAQRVIDTNWAGRGFCEGWEQKIEALYESGRAKAVGPELQTGVEACAKTGEAVYANAMRIFAAKAYIRQSRYDDAIKLLQQHYMEVKATRNPLMIATCDSVLADAYRKKGLPALAQQFATNVTNSGVNYSISEPLVTAYGVLYEIAKERGDYKAALHFHEQFAAADKAYLTDLSARHLAYQKVNHENIANKLQVDALNKQNHVLQLERELSGKAVETSRLYIVLLTMTVLFIGLWAYRTKRLQLHFQNLARLDGLTGICNRPHFITQAEKALEASRRGGEQLCIVLCDLDHFKQINDRYGHATGDFVLKRTVSACNIHLGKSDIFGRFGGEEFAFLLPACGVEDARQRAEQLRLAIAGITAYQTGNAKATVSASFGIAGTNASGHELGQLLAHADSALYEAKRMGRNRVVVYSHTPSTGEVPALAIVSTTGEFVQVTGRSLGGN
jgi:diguanylate cyclase (GGDEF)-like protein